MTLSEAAAQEARLNRTFVADPDFDAADPDFAHELFLASLAACPEEDSPELRALEAEWNAVPVWG